MEHPFTGCANEVIPFCRTRWPSVTAQESTEKRPVWNWEMRREKVRSHELVTSDHTNSSTLPTWLQLVIYLPLTSLLRPLSFFLEHSTLLSSLGPLCILFSKSVVYFSLSFSLPASSVYPEDSFSTFYAKSAFPLRGFGLHRTFLFRKKEPRLAGALWILSVSHILHQALRTKQALIPDLGCQIT